MVSIIEKKIRDKWGVSMSEVLGRRRDGKLPFARCMTAHFLRKYAEMTYSEIGREMNKDHSTVAHHIKLYYDLYEYDKQFRTFADEVEEELEEFFYDDFIC